jgi:hypothetical protein
LQVHKGVVVFGASSNLVVRVDFNAMPSSVSWELEEDVKSDGAVDAAQAPTKHRTCETDVLRRMDIYGCT